MRVEHKVYEISPFTIASTRVPIYPDYGTIIIIQMYGWSLLCKLYCNIDTDRHEHEMETSWIGPDFVRALNEANWVKMAWSVRMHETMLTLKLLKIQVWVFNMKIYKVLKLQFLKI
jgi:hypothetical protein